MVLNSPLFLFLFLPVALLVTQALPPRLKNVWLLAASLLFYAWGDSASLPTLIGAIAVNATLGRLIDQSRSRSVAGGLLALGIAVNLAGLLYYKYLPFAAANLAPLGLAPQLDLSAWHLPLGISFFTFSAISYLVDVYRRKIPAAQSLVQFGLYLALFPKIIAGPIVRYADLAAELEAPRARFDGVSAGVQRFILGLGKKVLIANPLAAVADAAFGSSGDLGSPAAWLGALCYTLQIYYDFSGYSDMAIGLGRMLGLSFGENFDYPYVSQSIQEFWRRWHISLSSWFRDYLYIPLGGNRGPALRTYFNLLVVFLLCGLWHGANWTFIAWGLYHGLFLVLERLGLSRALGKVPRSLRHLYALLVVMVGWVFFRADDIGGAIRYLSIMASLHWGDFAYFRSAYLTPELLTILAAALLGAMPLPSLVRAARVRLGGTPRLLALYDAHRAAFELLIGLGVLFASILQLALSTYNPFIYARF